jgi:hypothetical protein
MFRHNFPEDQNISRAKEFGGNSKGAIRGGFTNLGETVTAMGTKVWLLV